VALAVKAKPGGQKRGPGCRPDQGRAPARATPRFLACDGQPLLIAAWLVGFMRTRKPRKGQAMKMDIYQRITDQIVGELEKGVRPWNAELPLGVSPYRGINVLMLWSAAMEKGLCRAGLDDLQAGKRVESQRPHRRTRQPRRLCGQDHPYRGRHRPNARFLS